MRKHFLLLFLMALLPLAGWAADDVSTAWRVTIADVSYGDVAPAPSVKWLYNNEDVAPADYQVSYYTDAECTQAVQVTPGTTKLPVSATNYYVKVVALATSGYEGFITKSFKVNKAELTYTLYEEGNNAINLVATYKLENFTKTFTLANVKVTGKKMNENDDDLFTVTNGTWDYEGTDANATDAGALLPGHEHGYEVTLSGITLKTPASQNYTVSYVKNYVKIKQAVIDFTTQGTKFSKTSNYENAYTYNGNEQKPTYTIKYTYGAGENDFETLTVANGDFAVRYQDGDVETAVSPWFVNDDFNAYVGTVANTNYAAHATAANVLLGTFAIAKNTTTSLPIIVAPLEKSYDGIAYRLEDAQFITGQLADGDRGLTISGLTAELGTGTAALGAGAATYKVKAKITDDVTIRKNNADWKLSDLYQIVTPDADWTINRGNVTITVAAVPLTYGQAISASEKTITVSGAAEYNDGNQDVDENAGIKAYYEAVINTAYQTGDPVTTPYSTWTTATTPAQGTYPEAITVAFTQAAQNAHPLLANYNEPTIVKADLTVAGAPFTIQPIVTNVEYGTPVTATYAAYSATYASATVEGTPVYVYKELGADDETYTTDVPTEIGAYTVKVREGLTGTGNYLNGVPTFAETDFQITKKTLTFTIEDVSLWSGATLDILNSKVEYNKAAIAAAIVEKQGVKEDVGFNFFLTDPGQNDKYAVSNQGVITFQAGYVPSLIVEVELTGADAAHYVPAYTNDKKGKLSETNVVDDMPLALLFGGDDAENIGDAAAICDLNENTTYSVTIGDKDSNKKMLAKQWYAMVLPFDVTPAELVAKLGTYVVVNKIKSSSMNAAKEVTVSFELEMDNIAAGTPFIIKPAAEVNWYKATSEQNDANSIIFTGKEIKSAINAQPTTYATLNGTYDNDKSLKWGHDLDGNEEPGFTYAGANTDWSTATLKYRWLCDTSYGKKDKDGNLVNQWLNCKNNAHNLKPMEAYMVLDKEAVGVHVLVEDFENGTTTIKSLSADNIQDLKVAEGWYTINGMKLNAAPTEKGIYINNGKKVVVK